MRSPLLVVTTAGKVPRAPKRPTSRAEPGRRFRGRRRICGCFGQRLAEADKLFSKLAGGVSTISYSADGKITALPAWLVLSEREVRARRLALPRDRHFPRQSPAGFLKLLLFLERAKGFEPSTPTLARLCSTPELHPHPFGGVAAKAAYAVGGRGLQPPTAHARAARFSPRTAPRPYEIVRAASPGGS